MQAAAFLAGAIVFYVIVGDGPEEFFRTPLGLGLVYLAAALAGGRRGGHWSTAVVLVGWGLAVLAAREGVVDVDPAAAYLVGAGAGAAAAAALQRAGFDAGLPGVAGVITVAGLLFALEPEIDALGEARTYAVLVGLVGLANLALAEVPRGATAAPR